MKLLVALLVAGPVLGDANALQLFDAGEFSQAARAAARELENEPDRLASLVVLGRAQLTLDRAADAVQTLHRAARAHPQSAEAFYRLGQALTVRFAEVGTWRRMFLADDIGDAFARAVELVPDNAEYRWALFEFCRQAPGMVGGGRRKARAQAAALAELDAPLGHRARAALLAQDGRDDAAEAELHAAIAAGPDVADHRYALGYFYLLRERWDDAFAVFDDVVRRFPQEAQALFQVGKTAAMSGQRLDTGASALQRYLQHKPKAGEPPLAWAHYRLGLIHEQRGDRAAAAAAYEAALAGDPRLREAQRALAALGKR